MTNIKERMDFLTMRGQASADIPLNCGAGSIISLTQACAREFSPVVRSQADVRREVSRSLENGKPEGWLCVDVHAGVELGTVVPALAEEMQRRIRQAIAVSTGFERVRVNIFVENGEIRF